MSKPILVIDGLNVFYRHFIANPSMSENGESVGGIVGFLKGLQLLCERYNPDNVVIIWEGGGSPRRRSVDPTYKGGRRPERLNRFYSDDNIPNTVGNRNSQIVDLVDLVKLTGLRQVYVSDCEADDIIAYLVNAVYTDSRCVIVSTDKDFYQLINSTNVVWSPGSKKQWDCESVLKKFTIHPNNFCLARCFIGDASDGLKGVPGAGFRSLAKRFPSFESEVSLCVDDILTKCRKLREQKRLKLYDSIIDNEEIVRRNWKLMYLGQGNLSGTQIQKVEGALESEPVKRNKLRFIRSLMNLQIKNVDYDKLFMTLKAFN